jgi:Flp pilus assembly protein TadG
MRIHAVDLHMPVRKPMKSAAQAMLHLLAAAVATLHRLAVRRDGQTAIIFGLAAIPVVIAAGMAIDTARAYVVKTRLGTALDAAALATGSEPTQTAAQLTTVLNNYFYSNYCLSVAAVTPVTTCTNTVAGETNISVAALNTITDPTVAYQAQATVPMIFMTLVGVNQITVTVSAQTTKFPGMEVAVALDNTGSMLCGENDNAPNYNDSDCAQGVVTSDTTCTNANNGSRICTLINAANQFALTLQGAITAPQSIYMSIIPFVTTVNIANPAATNPQGYTGLCSGPTTCSNITTDSCSGDFTGETTTNSLPTIIYNPNQTTTITVGTTVTVNGTYTTGSAIVTVTSGSTSGMAAGDPISGTGIPSGDTIASFTATTITLTTKPTSNQTNKTLTVTEGGASTTSGSKVVTINSTPSGTLASGMVVVGPGSGTNPIPANSAIALSPAATQTSITLCQAATATATHVLLTFYKPVTFDSTFNTTNATTQNWGGCVIEPTSSDENSGVSTTINASVTDPDTTEPSGGWPSWYPLYWNSGVPSGAPTWPTVYAQNTSTETQGTVVGTYDQLPGPNAGCPTPILPLTDLTTTAGYNAITAAINAMWPKDSGGTQVHIGAIWGWRVLSPNSPFPANNGHPLSYATAGTTGWKKILVLMTDGTEEVPLAYDYTGSGYLAEGKLGSTSSTATAITNLGNRLTAVCNAMKASTYNGVKNFTIYTIGLGSDGASNAALQACPEISGHFYAATTSNLQSVFNSIAASIISLRLTE